MKSLWYNLVHTYVTLGLFFYFLKIKVVGKENIPTSGAVMFLPNHQNALIDALLTATTNGRRTHFLARADLFKNPIIRLLLFSVNMHPVYRMRDGWSTLGRNQESFDYCRKVFSMNECLLLFPEGNHDLKRRLRPLSKGFTRIIEHTLTNNKNVSLKIIPVGINYTDHRKYFGSVSLYYGEAIDLQEFLMSNPPQALKEEVSSRLKKLITHVEDVTHYVEQIQQLESHPVDYLDPIACNKLLATDPISESGGVSKRSGLSILKVIPLIFNFLPIICWFLIKAKIKDPVFTATARFAVGISLVPINLLVQGLILWTFSPITSLGITVASILSMPAYGILRRNR